MDVLLDVLLDVSREASARGVKFQRVSRLTHGLLGKVCITHHEMC
jgi:hypothetical protein